MDDHYEKAISMNWLKGLTYAAILLTLFSCGDGDLTQNESGADPTFGCDGNCPNSTLTVSEVERIISQAINEAQTLGVDATIAVVDRVGNVLGVYRMGNPEDRSVLITTDQNLRLINGVLDPTVNTAPQINAGLEGIQLPAAAEPLNELNLDHLAAISKAVTGAFLSSQGNAFTTRTANQIVQDHFNPGEDFQPGGPLFGVQFSQLACSDFIQPANTPVPSSSIGPRSSPLGLSADSGGFPLYKNGDVVGGIGVMADGIYGIDKAISDNDNDIDELISLAGSFGFGAPVDRRERVTVEGKIFRFSDADFENLVSDPTSSQAFSSIIAEGDNIGELVDVPGYTDGTVKAGTAFGSAESGIRPDNGETYNSSLDAFIFVDESDQDRFPPQSANDVGDESLNATEVTVILEQALNVANRARAQIRRPLSTPARVTISIVDTEGNILGMVRGRDAPVFGADVSLQKARTAAFFSNTASGTFLQNLPDTAYLQFQDDNTPVFENIEISSYVNDLRNFLENPDALSPNSTAIAFSDRAGGNLSRPFFPDGINGQDAGPLSKPAGEWSVFSTGLQLDLSYNAILTHAVFTGTPMSPRGCVGQIGVDALLANASPAATDTRLANGLQIFPGSVPIYRGSTLIGGIGVSGDGIDQDDMIAFLGLALAGNEVAVNNAPAEIRADNLQPRGTRLRYVQCPQAPFINSTIEGVCSGL